MTVQLATTATETETKKPKKKRPEWTRQPLVACVDGPLIHQWFTAEDWAARVEAARYLATERGQRPAPALHYFAGGTVAHPEYSDVTGRALHYTPPTAATALTREDAA